MNPELERLLALVSKVSQGLGEKITITQISKQPIAEDGRIFEKREGSVEVGGEIKDLIHTNRRLFSCGHIASTDSFGSVCCSPTHDYRRNLPVLDKNLDPATPFIGCRHCIKRCIVCHKTYCLFCIVSIDGLCYCKHCARWRKIKNFFFGRR